MAVKTRKTKKLVKFSPKIIAARVAKQEDKIAELKKQKDVMRLVSRGNTYEQVSEKLGMSVEEAFQTAKTVLERWTTQLTHTVQEARELDLKRLDAMLNILWDEATPKPMFDQNGFPIIDEITGQHAIKPPNLAAHKLMLEIIDKRSKLLGTEAAQKLDVNANVTMKREYVGVDPGKL